MSVTRWKQKEKIEKKVEKEKENRRRDSLKLRFKARGADGQILKSTRRLVHALFALGRACAHCVSCFAIVSLSIERDNWILFVYKTSEKRRSSKRETVRERASLVLFLHSKHSEIVCLLIKNSISAAEFQTERSHVRSLHIIIDVFLSFLLPFSFLVFSFSYPRSFAKLVFPILSFVSFEKQRNGLFHSGFPNGKETCHLSEFLESQDLS